MQTIIERLTQEAQEVKNTLTDLIMNYSSISRWLNGSNDAVVIIAGEYKWNDLSVEGKQLQTKLLKMYNHFSEILKLLAHDLPKPDYDRLSERIPLVIEMIEQKGHLWGNSKEEYLSVTIKEINDHLKLFEGLYDPCPNSNILVPDTNALLINPDIEKWSVDEMDSFIIVLMPVVLSELDKLKVDGKTEALREKARSLTRRIKEYIRRGDVSEGVKLSGKNMIRTIAVEADFDKSLPWLDPSNNDDRLLAFYFEAVRLYPRSNVILVTDDVNLQNKAANANASYIDPPEKE